MTRKSRALRKIRGGAADQPAVSKVRGPADVAVMIPYLLGFQPVESLVLVALEGPRKRFGPLLRVDLVDEAGLQAEQAAVVVEVMTRHRVGLVLVAAFSDHAETADLLVGLVRDGLAMEGIAVEDAFRTDGSRWWSYVCSNPDCCSPDGVAYDADSSRVAVEAVVSGLSFASDRDALRLRFAAAEEGTRREVQEEVTRLRREGSVHPWSVPALLPARVTAALASESTLTAAETAWLGLAVQSPAGRASALSLVDNGCAVRHFELWRTVMCRVDDRLLPPVGFLAGFSAWLDGRGVLASHAVDRIFEVAPGYPDARMLEDLLIRAVNPRTWSREHVMRDHDGSPPPLAG